MIAALLFKKNSKCSCIAVMLLIIIRNIIPLSSKYLLSVKDSLLLSQFMFQSQISVITLSMYFLFLIDFGEKLKILLVFVISTLMII